MRLWSRSRALSFLIAGQSDTAKGYSRVMIKKRIRRPPHLALGSQLLAVTSLTYSVVAYQTVAKTGQGCTRRCVKEIVIPAQGFHAEFPSLHPHISISRSSRSLPIKMLSGCTDRRSCFFATNAMESFVGLQVCRELATQWRL